MQISPTEIRRDGTSGLAIEWNDGVRSNLSSKVLRLNCPCAGCREQRGDGTHAKPLTGKKRSLMIVESTIEKELELVQIWGIGQYALGIAWADGHDTGIYTFPLLRELGSQVAQQSIG